MFCAFLTHVSFWNCDVVFLVSIQYSREKKKLSHLIFPFCKVFETMGWALPHLNRSYRCEEVPLLGSGWSLGGCQVPLNAGCALKSRLNSSRFHNEAFSYSQPSFFLDLVEFEARTMKKNLKLLSETILSLHQWPQGRRELCWLAHHPCHSPSHPTTCLKSSKM